MKSIDLDIEKFRIQVVSDIHMELRNQRLPIEISAEILALCGDIGSPTQDSYWEIIKWANTNYKHVFLITGNHEYYHKELTMDEIDKHIEKNIQAYQNVTFLRGGAVSVNYGRDASKSIRVFGCTLWSDTRSVGQYKMQRSINDYRNIRLDIEEHGKHVKRAVWPNYTSVLHDNCILNLSYEIDECKSAQLPMVVLTHHLPSFSLIHEDFRKPQYADINRAFASEVDEFIAHPIVFWAHGHSHRYNDTRINGVRVVCNPMGYPSEDTKKYREYLTVDVDAEMAGHNDEICGL